MCEVSGSIPDKALPFYIFSPFAQRCLVPSRISWIIGIRLSSVHPPSSFQVHNVLLIRIQLYHPSSVSGHNVAISTHFLTLRASKPVQSPLQYVDIRTTWSVCHCPSPQARHWSCPFEDSWLDLGAETLCNDHWAGFHLILLHFYSRSVMFWIAQSTSQATSFSSLLPA